MRWGFWQRTGFVDAHEGEVVALLGDAVDDGVGGGDVGEAGGGVAWGVDVVRDDLAAYPVADVVC